MLRKGLILSDKRSLLLKGRYEGIILLILVAITQTCLLTNTYCCCCVTSGGSSCFAWVAYFLQFQEVYAKLFTKQIKKTIQRPASISIADWMTPRFSWCQEIS